jgi:signal transduction histidine kinase
MKNLLQSLYTLTSMAPRGGADDAYASLLQRQLPQLTKRLQGTLDKLRSPEAPVTDLPVHASAWWAELEKRLRGSDVQLEATIAADGNIPAGLFDSFVENTLDNARAKRARDPGVRITISLRFDAELAELAVCDTGSAVAASVAQRLFREPVERAPGMGIGLYHLGRLAHSAGYRVELTRNRDGDVCFALLRGDAAAASGGKG